MHKDKEVRDRLRKVWDLTYYQKKRKLVDEAFGRECYFCHKSDGKVINIHRKDGKPHKKIKEMSLDDIKDLVANHKDEYVAVCSLCHTAVHWCMKVLGLTWNELLSRVAIVGLFGVKT